MAELTPGSDDDLRSRDVTTIGERDGGTRTTVDVAIVTRDRPHQIGRAVESVLASTHADLTLTVADQSTGGETREVVERHAQCDGRVRYLSLDSVGSSRARNTVIGATSGDYVLFTDDDCVVAPDWVEAIVDEFARGDADAVFGGLDPDDSHRPDDAAIAPWLGVAITSATDRRVFHPGATDISFGHGANMAFRRTALEMVGSFDPLLGVGGPLRSWPERDIGFRILQAGGRIVFQPAARVCHAQWRTWGEVFAAHRNYSYGAGAACAKYVRCGHRVGFRLFAGWILQLGFRQVVSGALRWRDLRKVRLGLISIAWPFAGAVGGLHRPVDRERCRYVD